MQALMGCRTSCSEIFLIEHGRKLCPRTNWNVADSTPECQTALKATFYWRCQAKLVVPSAKKGIAIAVRNISRRPRSKLKEWLSSGCIGLRARSPVTEA
jgi:hypothetical protein